jgi:hypothetical protein
MKERADTLDDTRLLSAYIVLPGRITEKEGGLQSADRCRLVPLAHLQAQNTPGIPGNGAFSCTAGIELGTDYPEPIVDLAFSRGRVLDAYAAAKR